MLKQRVITAVIMVAVFLSVLFVAPPVAFSVFITLVVAAAAWEWGNLCNLTTAVTKALFVVSVLLLGGVVWWAIKTVAGFNAQTVLLVSGIWWGVALLWVQGYPASAILWRSRWIRCVMGCLVLLPTWLAFVVLRGLPEGQWLILAVVLIVAAADIGAYFTGRAFGKRKLAPNVSPGKSWEGVMGGVVAALTVTATLTLVSGHAITGVTLLIGLATALLSVVGDLLESMLKRFRGIKDSGSILPGHGGVLDRIDGLVAAAPVFALVILATGWQM